MNCSDKDFQSFTEKGFKFCKHFFYSNVKKSFWAINSKNNFLSGNLSAEETYYSIKEAVT
jgi:hypothetical protein